MKFRFEEDDEGESLYKQIDLEGIDISDEIGLEDQSHRWDRAAPRPINSQIESLGNSIIISFNLFLTFFFTPLEII